MTGHEVVCGISSVVLPGDIAVTYYNREWWSPLPVQPCKALAWEMVARVESAIRKENVGFVALRRGDLDEDVALDMCVRYMDSNQQCWQICYCLSYVLPVAYADYYSGMPYDCRFGLETLPIPLQKANSDVEALLESGGYKLLAHEDPVLLQVVPGYYMDQIALDGSVRRVDVIAGEILFYSSLSGGYEQFGCKF